MTIQLSSFFFLSDNILFLVVSSPYCWDSIKLQSHSVVCHGFPFMCVLQNCRRAEEQ